MNFKIILLSKLPAAFFLMLATGMMAEARTVQAPEKVPLTSAAKKCTETIIEIAGNFMKEEMILKMNINQHSLISVLDKTIEALQKRAEYQHSKSP